MSQVFNVTFIDGKEWKLSLNFALGLHIAVILSAIYMPGLFKSKPKYADIYTIDLVNVQIPEPPSTDVPVPAAPPPPLPKKEKAVAVNPAPKKIEAVKNVKPVSIAPLKRKKIVKNNRIDTTQKQKLEQIHKQRLQEAKEAERLAEEAAKLAAMQAVNQLKDLLRESNLQNKVKSTTQTQSVPRSSQRKNTSVIESRYFASIYNTLQPHWKLPEYKIWDKDLVATIVIQISQDGRVTKQFFEKRSGDKFFDQFVLKTIQDGAPLPPIPAALQKKSLEIGLHFKPGSIQQF